jgi:hypothetical protein
MCRMDRRYCYCEWRNWVLIASGLLGSRVYYSTILCGRCSPRWTLASVYRFLIKWKASLGEGDQPVTRPVPTMHTGQQKYRIYADKRPCLEWDSNPRPQCLSLRSGGHCDWLAGILPGQRCIKICEICSPHGSKYKVVQIWPGLIGACLLTTQSRSYLNQLVLTLIDLLE